MELSARSYGQKDSKEGAAVRSFRRSNDDGPACSAKEGADRLRPTKATDVFWRGLFGTGHSGSLYVVEVDFFDFDEKVRLYCDGRLMGEQRSPARFVLDDGAVIEAAMALYGMKRAHLVDSGRARALLPLPGTAETLRLAFDREHPVASRVIAAVSWAVLAVALVTQIPNLLNSLVNGAAWLGFPVGFSAPTLALPGWLNTLLSVLGIVAGLDRGLRMVHNPLLDD
ncbi:hypothetical protein [Adlercreutzia caecimuris]|uniref:hypothetical protein n=1 Tax=Adlercreutzia caecimuris TaxID=671266 RepID=UPI00243145AB|nr:hypothetical protein [Adlercreutzia caecimuris]MCI9207798.1 hypothetical protein [Adlercreutzia caecimuris]